MRARQTREERFPLLIGRTDGRGRGATGGGWGKVSLTAQTILPDCYRLLVTAPDVRVPVNTRPGCQVVARYRGRSAPGRVERDAWEHAGRSGRRAARPGARTLGRRQHPLGLGPGQ